MKRFAIIIVSILSTLGLSAQVRTIGTGSDKQEEFRQKIGIDYSITDFDTKKIDGRVIGVRLAKILESLQKNYTQGTYNRQLANIRYEATEDPKIRFLGIDKFKILSVKKEGTVITIRLNTMVKNDMKEKLSHEFDVVFDKGVSHSDKVNYLFSDLSRYIR